MNPIVIFYCLLDNSWKPMIRTRTPFSTAKQMWDSESNLFCCPDNKQTKENAHA